MATPSTPTQEDIVSAQMMSTAGNVCNRNYVWSEQWMLEVYGNSACSGAPYSTQRWSFTNAQLEASCGSRDAGDAGWQYGGDYVKIECRPDSGVEFYDSENQRCSSRAEKPLEGVPWSSFAGVNFLFPNVGTSWWDFVGSQRYDDVPQAVGMFSMTNQEFSAFGTGACIPAEFAMFGEMPEYSAKMRRRSQNLEPVNSWRDKCEIMKNVTGAATRWCGYVKLDKALPPCANFCSNIRSMPMEPPPIIDSFIGLGLVAFVLLDLAVLVVASLVMKWNSKALTNLKARWKDKGDKGGKPGKGKKEKPKGKHPASWSKE